MSNIKAMDPSSKSKWVPKCDRSLPEAEQFTITYSPLRMKDEANISDDQIQSITKGKKSQYKYQLNRADVKRMELTIKGWDNFEYPTDHDDAGKPVPFSIENIELIPQEIRREYITDITGRENEDDDEEEGDTNLGEAEAA